MAHWMDTQAPCSHHGKQARGRTVTGWAPVSIANLLKNPVLKGEQRGSNGTCLHRSKYPLLSVDEWDDLQVAMQRGNKRDPGRTRAGNESALLTGVIFCDQCSGPMYLYKSTGKALQDGTRVTYPFYRCKGSDNAPSTCKNSINVDLAEALVHFSFMDIPEELLCEFPELPGDAQGAFAGLEISERVMIPGDDHTLEIAEVTDKLRSLDCDDPQFATKQAGLLAERDRLKELPATPATFQDQATGKTIGQLWATLDHAAKRRFLLASDVKVLVKNKDARMEGDPSKVSAALRTIAA